MSSVARPREVLVRRLGSRESEDGSENVFSMFMNVSGPALASTPLVYAPAKYILIGRYLFEAPEMTARQARRTSSEYEHSKPLSGRSVSGLTITLKTRRDTHR